MEIKKIILDFIDRNKPIFYIGALTAVIFFVIILLARGRETQKPVLVPVKEENFISEHTPVKGPDDAIVVIVEFTDFNCTVCADNQTIINKLLEKYPDDIQVAFRHFPLEQHKSAKEAAVAAQAAHRQNKFWEYINELSSLKELNKENFGEIAEKSGINKEQFLRDLEDTAVIAQVEEDLEFGEKLGVSATPTFYVNGRVVTTNLESEVRKEIERINPSPTTTKETTQSVKSAQDQQIDDEYGILEIRYTNNGFTPANTRAIPGQLIRFKNEAGTKIVLEQKRYLFKEMGKAVEIAAGEYFEFRVGKVGMKDVIWSYGEKLSGNIGSTLIISEAQKN